MKAIQYSRYGDSKVIEINTNVPIPSPGPLQVLVKVKAASINPIDYKVRKGYIKGIPSAFPATLGGDFSGIISKADASSVFKEGDEVFGQAGILNGGTGSMAEFALASIEKISQKPKKITHEQAAAIPLAGVSAVQALETHINLKSGQKILIHGGAGGIGTMAIQLAKELGAYVATTVSKDDIEYVKALGADEVIDYRKENFTKKIKGFDAVFDNVGGKIAEDSFQVIKKGGIIVSMVGQPHPELAKEKGIVSIGQLTEGTQKRLERLSKLVELGKIKVHIDKVFLMDHAREAFAYQEEKSPRGKVVIIINKNMKGKPLFKDFKNSN